MILDAKVRLVQNSAVKVDPTKQRTVIKSGLEKTCPSKKILVPQKKNKNIFRQSQLQKMRYSTRGHTAMQNCQWIIKYPKFFSWLHLEKSGLDKICSLQKNYFQEVTVIKDEIYDCKIRWDITQVVTQLCKIWLCIMKCFS